MYLPQAVEVACADPNTPVSAYEGLRPFLYACPTVLTTTRLVLNTVGNFL